MLVVSIFRLRLIRRPPDADMPLQFLKESETSDQVGTVVMVLSQLRTLTVVRPISMTAPSAPYFGISSQSPSLSMSLAESWIPATRPRIGSLNTSIRTAAMAPRPLIRMAGDWPISSEITRIPMIMALTSFMPWNMPFSGSCDAVANFCERLNTTSSSEKKDSMAYIITHS